jgi:hypothetical protein
VIGVAVPIFDARVPVSDLYVGQVGVAREDPGVGPGAEARGCPFRISRARVWHALVRTDETAAPWTTGAAMAVRGCPPLAHELLTYTPRGATIRLPLTVAVDAQAEPAGEEPQRSRDALRWNGYAYARVGVAGRLRAANREAVPIDLMIAVAVGGRADQASEGGEFTVRPYSAADWRSSWGDPPVNSSSRIPFRTPLAAGATAEPWVRFHYFLRQQGPAGDPGAPPRPRGGSHSRGRRLRA